MIIRKSSIVRFACETPVVVVVMVCWIMGSHLNLCQPSL